MAYLLLIIIVALAGIAKVTLQARREHKLHVQNDFRSSLQKVATQPLAKPDDGPRRRWELAGWTERRKARDERRPAAARRRPARGGRPAHHEAARRDVPRRQDRKPPARRPVERARSRRSWYEERQGHKRTAGRRRHSAASTRVRRERADYARHDDGVDWFEDLRAQPSEIRLDHDAAPARLPVSSEKIGQPRTRGQLQTQVHARIHPAHLPPSPAGGRETRNRRRAG